MAQPLAYTTVASDFFITFPEDPVNRLLGTLNIYNIVIFIIFMIAGWSYMTEIQKAVNMHNFIKQTAELTKHRNVSGRKNKIKIS